MRISLEAWALVSPAMRDKATSGAIRGFINVAPTRWEARFPPKFPLLMVRLHISGNGWVQDRRGNSKRANG
ncbi:hypothetical protein D3C87_2121740 [compost metagenome]